MAREITGVGVGPSSRWTTADTPLAASTSRAVRWAGPGLPASGEVGMGPSGPGRCGERQGTAAVAGPHLSLRAGAGGKTDRYFSVTGGPNLGRLFAHLFTVDGQRRPPHAQPGQGLG